MDALRKAIKQLASNSEYTELLLAKVTSVDLDKMVCDVKPDGQVEMFDVRLSAQQGSKGFRLVPKVGSYVLVANLYQHKAEWSVMLFSELDNVWIDSPDVVFNGGDNKGLVKVDALVETLNELINRVNILQNIIATHTHIATSLGVATTPSVPPVTLAPLLPKQATTYENQAVKH